MHYLLEKFSLQDLLQATEKKYPDLNIPMVKQALVHHEDVDFIVPIDYIGKKVEWAVISERLKNAFQNPKFVFAKLPPLTQKLMEKTRQKKLGRKGPRL